MNNSESGMAKKNIVVRFLAFSLAAIMMLGAFAVVPVLSVESEPEAEQSQSAQNNSEIVYDEDVLSITVDGEERTELEIYENEKVTIKAEGVLAAKYQWQILHPERSGLWVDIYEETKETLDVSLALTSNMEQEDGKTYLRCLAYEAEGAYVTDVLEVATLEGTKPIDAPEIPKLETGKVDYNLVQADGDDHPEFVTITVNYERWEYHYDTDTHKYMLENMGIVFNPYIATLEYNIGFTTPIPVPTVLGYQATMDAKTGFELSADGKYINPNLANVTSDIELTIKYVPMPVDYEVHYLFQNVYDDMYVMDTSINDANITNGIYKGKGYTGLPPSFTLDANGDPVDNTVDKVGIYAEFEGFTALYYQPDTIAADGSTVFEVYYERNYYLMEFDCDGGYGAHTIYARHGTYVYVPTPNKMGYILNATDGNYWDLVKNDDPSWEGKTDDELEALLGAKVYDEFGVFTGFREGNGTPDALPAVVPPYNTAYKVLWGVTDTTYTVVYWIDNGDDTKTYIGSRLVGAVSATEVSGGPDLTADLDLCGLEEHTHNSDCKYSCNKTEHSHGDGSCTCPVVPHTHDGVSCDYSSCDETHVHDMISCTWGCGKTEHATHTRNCYTFGGYSVSTSATTLNNPELVDDDTLIFPVYRDTSWRYYVAIEGGYYRIDTNWWNFDINNLTVSVNTTNCHTHTEACCIGHVHDDNCCSVETHNHNDSCCTKSEHNHTTSGCALSCGQEEHAHSDQCKVSDAVYMEFVDADGYGDKKDIVVDGDGSTVVNVYYTYKTYTIRFVYARTNSAGDGEFRLANSTGCGQYNNVYSDSIDHNGSNYGNGHSNVNWGYTVTSLPTINDKYNNYYNNAANHGFFQDTDGGYRYYYISLTAKYGENIESIWPDAAINSIGGYSFGSWGAECASGYRQYNAEHANIVGPYPVMSAEMIVDPNNPIAQTMVAWWGGSSDSVGNHAYHIYYEVSADDKYDVEKDGRYYVLDRSMEFTAAHNGTTRVDPFYYKGYTIIAEQKNGYSNSSASDFYHPNCSIDANTSNHDYCNSFYYNRNIDKTFALYNYNSFLNLKALNVGVESANWPGTPFGEELFDFVKDQCENKFDPTNNPIIQDDFYPNGIEPGAYEFGGWYTTPACYEGTEVDWNTITMPDGNLTLYAKWTAIKRNVYFHLLYTDINYDDIENSNFWYPDDVPVDEREDYYPIEVAHGSLLETAYSHTPTRVVNGEEYQFVGWFYFDENGKKKFAPDSMKVTRDLVLFAEWFTTSVTTYKVEYMAYDYVNGGVGDILIDDEIAKPLNDYSSAGKTVTFNAKGGSAMYNKTTWDVAPELKKDYTLHWFPHTSSHSILMDEEEENNTFVFKYYNKDKINYKVMYINRINGEEIADPKFDDTENAIVTERFKPINGYLPEEYYIQHSVAYDPTDYTIPGNENHVLDENIIYFYYVPDEDHALYRIEHYQQDIDDEESYTLFTAEQGPHDIGVGAQPLPIKANEPTGFELAKVVIIRYPYNSATGNYEETKVEYTDPDDLKEFKSFEEQIEVGGLTVEYYYNRKTYSFSVQYVENIAPDRVLATNPIDDVVYEGKYGSTVSVEAHPTFVNSGDGLTYIYLDGADASVEKRTKTKQITDDPNKNVITFMYYKKTTLVQYEKVSTVPSLIALNAISLANETIASADVATGSKATAGTGFEFKGWFKDKECTEANRITDSSWYKDDDINTQHLMPESITDNFDGTVDDKITFYALFEPVYGNLKVTKKHDDNVGTVEPTESFLFHIKGKAGTVTGHIDMIVTITNAGSKIIEKLPIGEYTVSEMESWSYTFIVPRNEDGTLRFELVQSATVKENDTVEVLFERAIEDSDWLTGEDIDDPENNNN